MWRWLLLLAGLVACGSRTGLDAEGDAGPTTTTGVLCDSARGSISSCADRAGTEVARCTSSFPRCLNVGAGQFQCCSTSDPYTGPAGGCVFATVSVCP